MYSAQEVRRVLGLKNEATPYSYPQSDLAAGDFDFLPFNIKYSATIEEAKRALASGDMSKFTSIMGKRSATVSFSVYMAWSGTIATAAKINKIFKSCGMQETVYAGAGVGLTLSALCTAVPSVIEVLETFEGATVTQLAIQLRGAMGNCKLQMDGVGQYFRADFDFTGVLQTIEDRSGAALKFPASYDTTLPSPVLAAAITAFTETQDLDLVSIDFGNKVELYPDPAAPEGFSGAHITDREPTLTINPYLQSLSSRPFYTRMVAGTTGAFSAAIGTSLVVTAPAIQCVEGYKGGARNGAATNELKFNLTRGAAGNDELEILQGAKA